MKPVALILANSDSGLYDFRKELLKALLEKGFQVAVSVPDTGYVEKIRSLGVECIPTVMDRRGMNPAKDFKLLTFYMRQLQEKRPSIVLTYTIKPNIYGGLACRLKRVPYLVNITGLGTALEHGGMLQKFLVLLYRMALKKARCIFFQNTRNKDFMMEKGCIKKNAPVKVIPGSGVNLSEHEAKPFPKEEKVRFLSIMRLMKDKGIEELLQAAEEIHREYPETTFELLGAYEEETRKIYEPRVRDLQSQGVLQYYGYRDDVPDFLEHAQAVIHPSYHEGMSNVLLEAAATARPVLASNVTGCKETFEDNVSGIAFEPGNAKALTEAIRKFLALSVKEREEMGEKGRAYVETHFDRKLVVEAYLEAIKTVCG